MTIFHSTTNCGYHHTYVLAHPLFIVNSNKKDTTRNKLDGGTKSPKPFLYSVCHKFAQHTFTTFVTLLLLFFTLISLHDTDKSFILGVNAYGHHRLDPLVSRFTNVKYFQENFFLILLSYQFTPQQ
jgi:hypothetical protein